nr:hypothetical protein [Hyphobacterium sp. CCMP332]
MAELCLNREPQLFHVSKPKTAKRLYFDVIPKAVDEYHQQLRAYAGQDITQRLNNPVHHIHNGDVPESRMVVPFSMLLNLASVSAAHDKETLWGFIRRYAPEASAETHPDLDAAAGYAVRYYEDFVAPAKTYRAPTDLERAAMLDLIARFKALDPDLRDGETIQNEVYSAGKAQPFDNLRDWFKGLYEVLLGQSQGPRFGGFVAIYGIPETIALIERGLAGELVAKG